MLSTNSFRLTLGFVVIMLSACTNPKDAILQNTPIDFESQLGKRITVEGMAIDHKVGATIHSQDQFLIYIDLKPDRYWLHGLYLGGETGEWVRVTGTVIERHDLPVFIQYPNEPLPQGMPRPPGTDLKKASRRLLLTDVIWELVDSD